MREHVIPMPNGRTTTVHGPAAPSRHGAAVCRVSPGRRFHDPVWFSATFTDAPARLGIGNGPCRASRTKVGFFVPRDRALAVAAQLYSARNAMLHGLQQDPMPTVIETAMIDGVAVRIEGIEPPHWVRVILAAGHPIFGPKGFGSSFGTSRLSLEMTAEAADDFCSGFLSHFADAAP